MLRCDTVATDGNIGRTTIVVETIMRVGLKDLTTLPIVCDRCKTAIEVKIERLSHDRSERGNEMKCPGCGALIRRSVDATVRHEDAFDELARAWESIAKLTSVRLEFVVREPQRNN
jgi:RecJ-like exonuclease